MTDQYWLRFIQGIGVMVLLAVIFTSTTVWSSEDDYMSGYTGADAEMKGSETCVMCHSDQIPESAFAHVNLIDNNPDSEYYGYGCEGCHGPGGDHMGDINAILAPWKMSKEQIAELCTKCHSELGNFDIVEWDMSEHYNSEMSCLDCHGGHSEYESFLVKEDSLDLCYECHSDKRSEFKMRSHHPVEENHMGCGMCHNVHSGRYDSQLLDDCDELCFACHGDKQGPFIYDHDISMASGGDGCMTCHFVHGSNTDNLTRLPHRLCIQCHSEQTPGNHFAGTCWSAGCHVQIHGSNSHPLFFE